MTTSNIFKFVTGSFRSRLMVFQELSEVYRGQAVRRREKLLGWIKEKSEVAAKSELAAKMRVAKGFYRLEMAPPTTAEEMQRLKSDLALAMKFMSSGAYKYMTVKQAWLLFLVVNEVWLWFYLGETIGKGRLVGYVVKH